MSASQDTILDLEVIASLLRPEDLDPLQTDQHPSIKIEDATRTTQKEDGTNEHGVSIEEAITSQPTKGIKDEEDEGFIIPGLGESMVSGKAVPAMDTQMSSAQAGSSGTGAKGTDIDPSPSSGNLDETTLSSILAKHNLQLITSESSDESGETSEESDDSTSESDSDDSSDSDSDSTSSSEASEDLPMRDTTDTVSNGDAGDLDSSTESSRLKAKHRRNKARLDKMVQDDEDGLDLPSGVQPLAMFATAHEIIAPQVTMPSITEVPDDEHIELVGEVMSIVDSVIVVKSLSNGMQRVLDTDSLLVLENRKVLGLVFETFGPLTAPLYSIRFPSSAHFPTALSAFAESPKDHRLKVYYCPSRSTFAYTSKLMLNKGNDASNLYDEEVAEEDLEFSDDEAEREWKRLHGKDGPGGKRKRRAGSRAGSVYSESSRLGESSMLPYDDEMDENVSAGGDTSLSYVDPYDDEPANSHETAPSTSHRPPHPSSVIPPHLPIRPNNNYVTNDRARGQGRGQSRGRGQSSFASDRGRGRGRGRQPSRERGRQPPQGHYPPRPMGPPLMTGYSNHAEYDPSFAGNISPTDGHMSHSFPTGAGGGMHGNAAGFPCTPHMSGMDFQPPFMGFQPSQAYGMPNAGMNMHQGMHGGGGMMRGSAGPSISPGMGGPSPGAYVNPRFAMMQLLSPGGQPGQNSGPYQYGESHQDSGQGPPQ